MNSVTRSQSWPNHQHHKNKIICDNIHVAIPLFHPIHALIDSPEFQRLRNIKQLGVASWVYPGAVHDRFIHSLGAHFIAYKFITHLREIYKDSKDIIITSADVLCVSTAALLHDIGHGAFSHLFDGTFAEYIGKTKKHETIGTELTDRIFNRKEIYEVFEPFLGTFQSDEWNRNITFIKELIEPKKYKIGEEWPMTGRGKEQSFLYNIVSNAYNGIDIDKWDYLLRDSYNTGVSIPFDQAGITRLITYSRILMHDGLYRICYGKKAVECIRNVGESRQLLHEKVYQHKKVIIIDHIVAEVLKAARKFEVLGSNNRHFALDEVHTDLDAYLKTNDHILLLIENAKEGMDEAKKLLEQLSKRQVPKLIISEELCPEKCEEFLETINRSGSTVQQIRDYIKEQLEEKLKDKIEKDELLVLSKNIDRGQKKNDPVSQVVFYTEEWVNDEWTFKTELFDPSKLRLKAPEHCAYYGFLVYRSKTASSETTQEENLKLNNLIRSEFKTIIKKIEETAKSSQ